jgi:hypothetical protein
VKPHLRYLWYVLRHKWYVFRGCLVLGVPLWRALIHDASKFSRAEWGPYVRRFFGGRGSVEDKQADPQEFRDAWLHHWTRNPHHWEYWLSPAADDGSRVAQPMPTTYVREMVADWYGAGMAQGKPDIYGWYAAGEQHRQLHEETRALVQKVIKEAQRKGLFP